MKRTRLKPVSDKRRALNSQNADRRFQFKSQHGCDVCGEAWERAAFYPRTLDVHEMIGGGMKAVTQGDARAWLSLCRQHHDEFQNRGRTPYVVQFAWKKLRDPDYYDLEWLMLVGGWAPGFITEEQVSEEVKRLKEELGMV